MPNMSADYEGLLVRWFTELVEIMRARGGPTWDLLVRTASGRSVTVDIDNYVVRLDGHAEPDFHVRAYGRQSPSAASFRIDRETLGSIVAGRLTVDGAIATGRIFVRASLADLLWAYLLTMNLLADTPSNP